jgi:hypothetical protein
MNDIWKYAIVGGIATIPFTSFSYWQTGSEISLSPVFLGGLLAGYLAKRQLGKSSGVGVRAGLVGALPVLWVLFDMITTVSRLSNPLWFSAVLVILTIVIAGLLTGMAVLAGELGARVGGWLTKYSGQRNQIASGGYW